MAATPPNTPPENTVTANYYGFKPDNYRSAHAALFATPTTGPRRLPEDLVTTTKNDLTRHVFKIPEFTAALQVKPSNPRSAVDAFPVVKAAVEKAYQDALTCFCGAFNDELIPQELARLQQVTLDTMNDAKATPADKLAANKKLADFKKLKNAAITKKGFAKTPSRFASHLRSEYQAAQKQVETLKNDLEKPNLNDQQKTQKQAQLQKKQNQLKELEKLYSHYQLLDDYFNALALELQNAAAKRFAYDNSRDLSKAFEHGCVDETYEDKISDNVKKTITHQLDKGEGIEKQGYTIVVGKDGSSIHGVIKPGITIKDPADNVKYTKIVVKVCEDMHKNYGVNKWYNLEKIKAKLASDLNKIDGLAPATRKARIEACMVNIVRGILKIETINPARIEFRGDILGKDVISRLRADEIKSRSGQSLSTNDMATLKKDEAKTQEAFDFSGGTTPFGSRSDPTPPSGLNFGGSEPRPDRHETPDENERPIPDSSIPTPGN